MIRRGLRIRSGGLTDFLYFTGPNAARTDMQTHMRAMCTHCFYRLNVRFGKFLGPVVGMAHFVSAEFAFPANFALTGHVTILH